MDLGLGGKVALVCGGSKGLGYGCAEALAEEGMSVAIAARGEEDLKAAAKRLSGLTDGKVTHHVADVSNRKDIGFLVGQATEAHGRIDVLVTNSGGPTAGSTEALHESDWDAAYEVVLKQVVRLVDLVAPKMKEQGWGRILNIVSSSYKEPIEGLVLSNAFRPAVVGLAKTLSRELGPHGITVNNIAPGRFDTDRLRALSHKRAEARGGTPEEWMERFGQDSALGRTGAPRELGDVAAFLASDRARFVTGITVPVDGGLLKSI